MILPSSLVQIPKPDDGDYMAAKYDSYYEFGNNEHNHAKLLELFNNLWNFSQRMHVPVNEIEFAAAVYYGPRCAIFEILWFDSPDDEWRQVENLAISQEVYGKWTALIIRAAETVAHTVKYPHELMRIEHINWINFERFAVTYIEQYRLA